MTILIAQKNILYWDEDKTALYIKLDDPWFGGEVIEPGMTFVEHNLSEAARLVVLGAARFQQFR